MTTPAPRPVDPRVAQLLDPLIALETRVAQLLDPLIALETRVTALEDRATALEAIETPLMVLDATPEPTGNAAILDRVTALEARVGELLGAVTELQPDVFEARRKLNTADEADRPQALANLNAAKSRIRHQAEPPATWRHRTGAQPAATSPWPGLASSATSARTRPSREARAGGVRLAMVTHVAIEHLHIAPSAWATAVFTAHCPGCRGHLEENR